MAVESGSVGSDAGGVRTECAVRERASCDRHALPAARCSLTLTAAVSVSVSVVRIPTVVCSIRTPPFERLFAFA